MADDLCGSDHFPILLQTIDGLQQNFIPRFKLHRADWTKFQFLCEERLVPGLFEDQDQTMDHFTRVLHQVAEESIPKTTNTKNGNTIRGLLIHVKNRFKIEAKLCVLLKECLLMND